MNRRILVIDDEPQMRLAMCRVLEKAGYVVEEAGDGAEGVRALARAPFDGVITDVRMPRLDGAAFLEKIRRSDASITVIVVSAYGTVEQAVKLVRDGADDYLLKPFSPAALCQALDGALSRRRAAVPARTTTVVHADLPSLPGAPRVPALPRIQTEDAAMQALLETARRVARVDATVLIQAESGTGKELLARFIHDESPRHAGPFVAVNVAALPGQLLESELFGHLRGAFTGADRDRKGWFEIASGGTLLLDEVGEMPAELQVKLLRVLQERTVVPVGAEQPRDVDVRLLAATHRDLVAEVTAGRFRADLFYRLHVLPLHIPPLRERRDDIGILARHFAKEHGAEGLEDAAVRRLETCSWPGNVRELENSVQRAAVLSGGRYLNADDFPDLAPGVTGRAPGHLSASTGTAVPVGTTIGAAERVLIQRTLAAMDHNRTRAAGVLGISVRTLRNKLQEYARVDEPQALPRSAR